MKSDILIKTHLRKPPYAVRINTGCLATLPAQLAAGSKGTRVFIITDSNVRKIYGRRFLGDLLVTETDAWLIDFPAGEASKNAGMVNTLHTRLLELGVKRDSLIVALGGGVVGDVAGYVAATVLRGIQYVQVPTTLLAQVDSSVGGKVGIDHPLGKNLIGAFHRPVAVYIDPLVLQTLPEREYRAGLAESVKIAAALDSSYFRFIERNASQIKKRNMKALGQLIQRSVQLKAAVVQHDEQDSGLRKTLNLGHTIGHALEAAGSYTLRHGEAVAMGLVAESKIARDMGLLKTRDFARLLHLMHSLGLPLRLPAVRNKEAFLTALSIDKKSMGMLPKFVLLKGIGRTIVGVNVPGPFIDSILGQKR